MEAHELDIVDFLDEMRREHGEALTHAMVYRMLVNGVLPGRRYLGRWRLPPEAKRVAAERLGLKKRTHAADNTAA